MTNFTAFRALWRQFREQWLVGLNVGPITRNTYRRDLRTLFSYCHERGFASSNPVAAASRAKEVANLVGILAVEELSRLLTVGSPKIIPFLAIGAFAGLRSAEVSRLDWAEIDLADGLIEVTARNSKTAQRRLVTVLPNLKAWLEPHHQLSGPVAPLNLRKLLRRARKGANIAEWPSNALRHSYASYHLAHFRDAAALALQMGHTGTNLPRSRETEGGVTLLEHLSQSSDGERGESGDRKIRAQGCRPKIAVRRGRSGRNQTRLFRPDSLNSSGEEQRSRASGRWATQNGSSCGRV